MLVSLAAVAKVGKETGDQGERSPLKFGLISRYDWQIGQKYKNRSSIQGIKLVYKSVRLGQAETLLAS